MSITDKKVPMITRELFLALTDRLRDQHKLPMILDYFLPCGCEPVMTNVFEIRFQLNYGGSEGIYLDVYASGCVTDENKEGHYRIGVCKTLHEDDSAMHTMAVLGADFVCEGRRYIAEHTDDLRFLGFKVSFYRKSEEEDREEKLCYGIFFQTKDSAMKQIHTAFGSENKGIVKCVLTDFENRCETTMWKEAFSDGKITGRDDR